jgi:hypothetical protein
MAGSASGSWLSIGVGAVLGGSGVAEVEVMTKGRYPRHDHGYYYGLAGPLAGFSRDS